MIDTVSTYDKQAPLLAQRYEGVSAMTLHEAMLEFIPKGQDRLALDVGAGSGRDAAWLASLGFDVVAVEPAEGMRLEGQRLHPDPCIRWLDDRLPALAETHKKGLAFDLILLSAVWMHVPPGDRDRAFRKLVTLLKPGGTILVSLREGPSEPGRQMWSAPLGEIEALASSYGLSVLKAVRTDDQLRRDNVCWTNVALRLPDDGAGALPLLRGIIVNDSKSSTYKLALLRAVLKVADLSPALVIAHQDRDEVEIPLGLVALHWVRMYLPLVGRRLPQLPGNEGLKKLSFAGEGFRASSAAGIIAQDLRVGAEFTGDRAAMVHSALLEARATISRMPATYIRFPNSNVPVFVATRERAKQHRTRLCIDAEYVWSFGSLSVPGPVWRTLQRLGAWIEPVLVSEWSKLIRGYAERMSTVVSATDIEAALGWLDPVRDTLVARGAADRMVAQGRTIECVWTGQSLRKAVLDIDHCMPWSAWPCGDLWNLLPSSRQVNQHLKRERLPSAETLLAARDRITEWWQVAWDGQPALKRRFVAESQSTLIVSANASMDDLFAALEWRRLKLRQDQQVEEWTYDQSHR
jgi:SAM-dependent methyltransferase